MEISLELVKYQLRLGYDLQPRDYDESHSLTTQPRTLNRSQITAKQIKQITDAMKFLMLQIVIIAKVPPNK